MSEWKEHILGDFIEVINGYAFKSSNFLAEKKDNVLPVIKIKNVANGDVHLNDCQYHLFDESLKRFLITRGDILLALTGNHPEVMTQVVGEVSRFKLDEKALLNQRVAKIISKNELNNDFLYYFLKDDNTHDYLASQSAGSANQANISKGDIENVPIQLPPLPEQQAIAELLSSLDDKIDLLHSQNKTLEQLAQTLFRQWFLEDASEVEEIPLSEIADHIKENVNPAKFPEKVFKHYSLPAFDNGKEPKLEIGKEILSNKYKVVSGSILISKLNPRFPRIWSLYGEADEDASICSTEFQVVRPKKNHYFGFIYCFLHSYQAIQELVNAASGTSGSHQRVNPQDIFNLSFTRPNDNALKLFNEITGGYWDKMKNNQTQIRTLTHLRNNLLPKLMCGEARVEM